VAKGLKQLLDRINDPQNLGSIIRTAACFGNIAIGGSGQNTYRKDHSILIDLGGNDVYLNHAAHTTLDGFGAAVLIDVEGDDTYRADNHAQSSAMAGVTALADDRAFEEHAVSGCSGSR